MACPVMGWSPVTMITWHSLQARREGRSITLIPALLHSATALGTVALGGSIMLEGRVVTTGGRREEGGEEGGERRGGRRVTSSARLAGVL